MPHSEKKICIQYKQNNCKFGIASSEGKGCKFNHPKRCTKLMKHGTKAEKGCNLGKKCADFHPKMCPLSIAKGECYDDRCTLCHGKGTRRKEKERVDKKGSKSKSAPDETKVINTDSESNENQKTLQQSFLEQISLLKKELQEAMDLKISSFLHPTTTTDSQKNHYQSNQLQPPPTSIQQWQMPQQQPLQMLHPQAFHQMQYNLVWYPPQGYLPIPQLQTRVG